MQHDVALEGVLFYKSGPVRRTELCEILSCSDDELRDAIHILDKRLHQGATRLLVTDDELQLVTAPELSSLIETLRKEELKRDIGKAGAETLAIILYKGSVTRAEIDSIRGVNSAYIIRNLLTRGLIERDKTSGSRALVPTPALLAHLGVTHIQALPHYAEVRTQLEAFEAAQTNTTP